MNDSILRGICFAYELGEVLLPQKPITGGLLHKMWRLETSKGVYAVKVLNPEIMRRPNILPVYIESERIAREAFEAGIPAITALYTLKGPILKTEDGYAIVYPWVEGRTLSENEITPAQAEIIGTLLAKIHQLGLQLPKLETPKKSKTTEEHWRKILTKAKAENIPLMEGAEDNVLQLAGKIGEFRVQLHQLDIHMVVSHGDLDKKNVIWKDDNSPVIIDWESAGYVHPSIELMIAAQDWSDLKNNKGDLDLLKAVVSGYKNAGGKLRDFPETVFYGSIEATLNWLEYNIRRSYEKQFGEEERQLGRKEISTSMEELMLLNERKEEIIQAFR